MLKGIRLLRRFHLAYDVLIFTVLEAFGPQRLMFGSDWLVPLLAGSYARWHAAVREAARLVRRPAGVIWCFLSSRPI